MSLVPTVVRISFASLRRDRAALVLTFVLPLVFFTVFAAVFADLDRADPGTIALGLAVGSDGVFSGELHHTLVESPALTVRAVVPDEQRQARDMIAGGTIDAMLVLPDGFDEQVDAGDTARVEILVDSSNPLIGPAVSGHLMEAVIETASRLSDDGGSSAAEPIAIDIVDVVGGTGKRASTAFFAAGLGVLFLMLSISNRAGMLLDERDNGTLERMLSTQLGMSQYLLARGAFLSLLGLAQITVMFLWAALAFDLPLLGHLGGFALMAVLSAVAAAGFAVALALLCRTREQLTASSIVIVLILAAVGGNLFPRFLMPEWLQSLGWWTFNAWALDGFQQVFWYDAPVSRLGWHVLVLVTAALGFFALAGMLSRRWAR